MSIYWIYTTLFAFVLNFKENLLILYPESKEKLDYTFHEKILESVFEPVNHSFFFQETTKNIPNNISKSCLKIKRVDYKINSVSFEPKIKEKQEQKIKIDTITHSKRDGKDKIETLEDYLKVYPELKSLSIEELIKNVKINGTLVIKLKKSKKDSIYGKVNKSSFTKSLKELISSNQSLLTMNFEQLLNELKISESGEIIVLSLGVLKNIESSEILIPEKYKKDQIIDSLSIQNDINDSLEVIKERKDIESKGINKETKAEKNVVNKIVKPQTKILSTNRNEYVLDRNGNKIFNDGAVEKDGVLTFQGRIFKWGKKGEKVFLDEKETQTIESPIIESSEEAKKSDISIKNTSNDKITTNAKYSKKDSLRIRENKKKVKAKINFISANVTTKGKVVSGGNVIAKARVIIHRDGQFYKEVTTDKQGMFKVLLNRDGIYIIEAVKEGFISEKQTVTPGQLKADASNIFLNFGIRRKEKEAISDKEIKAALSRETIKKDFENILCEKTDIKTVGIVHNKKKVIEGAKIRMLSGTDLIGTTNTDEFGRFKWALPKDKKIKFIIEKDGFGIKYDSFDPKKASFEDFLNLEFEIEESNNSDKKNEIIHFVGSVSSEGRSLSDVFANIFLEGEKFKKISTDEFGYFHADITKDGLYTIILKKENYYSNQISFFTGLKTFNDTLKLHFDMPIRSSVIKTGKLTFNNQPIYEAEVKVYQDGRLITSTETNKEGNYEVTLRANNEYTLMINKNNFFKQELNISTFGEKGNEEEVVNLEMKRLKASQVEQINNVYFEYNKADVNFYAKMELMKLAEFIKLNQRIREIEISAHTDNRGSKGYNLNLSQKRAEACVSYLISLGVNRNILKAKGYGESKPKIDVPLNEKEHAMNRRVEFEIKKIYK